MTMFRVGAPRSLHQAKQIQWKLSAHSPDARSGTSLLSRCAACLHHGSDNDISTLRTNQKIRILRDGLPLFGPADGPSGKLSCSALLCISHLSTAARSKTIGRAALLHTRADW
ncbi:unnamed protein product [Cercospora beticola]|nr:unnamed protein product [Cercospora beticola]